MGICFTSSHFSHSAVPNHPEGNEEVFSPTILNRIFWKISFDVCRLFSQAVWFFFFQWRNRKRFCSQMLRAAKWPLRGNHCKVYQMRTVWAWLVIVNIIVLAYQLPPTDHVSASHTNSLNVALWEHGTVHSTTKTHILKCVFCILIYQWSKDSCCCSIRRRFQVELPLREPLFERNEPRFEGDAVGVASPSLSSPPPSALRSIFRISLTHSVLVSLRSAGAWTQRLMSGSNGLSSSLRIKDIRIVWMKWSRRASFCRLKAYSWFHSSQAINPAKECRITVRGHVDMLRRNHWSRCCRTDPPPLRGAAQS